MDEIKNGEIPSSRSGSTIKLEPVDLHFSAHESECANNKPSNGEHKSSSLQSTMVEGATKITRFILSLKLELITFLYMTAYMLRSNTAVTMLMDRVCRVHLNYSDYVCDNLTQFKEQKTIVETMANNYSLGHTLIALLPSSVLACFIGPWSDRYGRRFPMIVGLIGIILDDCGSTIWAHFPRARAEFYFIPPLFSGLSGGFISALTVIYSYASDITPTKDRTIKYAILEAAIGFAIPLGVFSGGIIYKYYSFLPVFASSFIIHVIDLIVVYLFLKESRGIGNKDSWSKKIRVFFSSRNFLEGFKVALKSRPHKGKLQLWMLLLAMSISILIQVGAGNISFLFTHHHYGWGNTMYSTVSSIFSVMTVIVMMITVPIFTKLLHLSDPMLGIIGSISLIGKLVCMAIGEKQGLYYLGSLISLLSSTPNLAGRARISKIIPKNDLGKVFAFLSTVESLLPIVSSIAISQLFNATVGKMPDPTFSLFAILNALMLAIFIWIYLLPKVNYEEMREKEDKQECTENDSIKDFGSIK